VPVGPLTCGRPDGVVAKGMPISTLPAPPSPGYLAPLNAPGENSDSSPAVTGAIARARSSGRPTAVGSMTTQTMTVTALPHGGFRLRESLLPVRVRRLVRRAGREVRSWLPVSTALRRAGGVLQPVAVPDDDVTFSDGGAGPVASLSAGRKRLALHWPGRLPVPVVSGASARYRNVRPGIDLVVTATSQQAGGFWVKLDIKNRTAALELGSRGLALKVTTRGAGFVGQPVTTWDSGRLAGLANRRVVNAASQVARLAGAALAPPGFGLGGGSGPAPGALVAQAQAAAGGRVLDLVPAAGIARSSAARYPLQVGTSFTVRPAVNADTLPVPEYSADGNTQAYDVLKQACNTSQLEVPDGPSAKYSWLGTGYDDWPFGDCLVNGTYVPGYSYAYYRFSVPTKIDNSTISSAAGQGSGVHAWEAWSADCTSSANVTASWSGSIDANTDWSNTAWRHVTDLVTNSVGPDTSSNDSNCGGSQSPIIDGNCSQNQLDSCPNYLAEFFKMPVGDGSVLQNAADGSWKNLTIRLWEEGNAPTPQGSGGQNHLVWKQWSNNPYLDIFYDHSPNAPGGGKINVGGSDTTCLQSNSKYYPRIGRQSGNGVTIKANFKDFDGDSMNGAWQYKQDSSSTWNTVDQGSNPQTITSGGAPGNAIIPASWINGLTTDGTVVDWRVQANDGAIAANGGNSPWSGTCHFKVYTTAPPEPTISANSAPTCPAGTAAGTIVPGCAVSFTITSNDVASDPAAEFVWTMDQDPPDSNPRSGEVINLNSGQKSAKVTVTIPSPGPHALYAYVVDQAAVNSKPGVSPQLSPVAGGDPPSVPPFPSFSGALGANASWDNQIISSASGSPGTADGDGSGDAIDEAVLKQAGWRSGGTVTVDGATITLPRFGSANLSDNILAAGQTIDLPANSQGASLVILATSTNASAAAPLFGSASYPGQDTTTPYVPGNSAVTGLQCDEYQSSLPQGSGSPYCQVPLGAINYTAESGASQQQYYLTVPDWITGPASDAAVELAGGWDTPGGGSQSAPNIYAFSVPLNLNAAVQSVTLPDIGASVSAVPGVSPGGGLPGLHIFGFAVSNTTTATPGLASSNLPAGQTWTAAWASPSEGLLFTPTGTGWGGNASGQTIRTTMTVASGGPDVRLRLSDDLGWYLGSMSALHIGAVSVAQAGTGGALTGTIYPATFSGSGSVAIAEGGDAYTDPIPITVTPGEKLAVSIYLASTFTYPTMVEHTNCTDCTTYVTATNGGDQTETAGTSAFGSGNQFSSILTSLDVQTSGIPTVAVLGDNVIDAFGVSDIPATAPRLSDDLVSELIAADGSGEPEFSVINEGIQANGLLTDSLQLTNSIDTSGPSAVTRLPEDVLSEPNVGTVVLDEGLEDLLNGQSQSTLGTAANSLTNFRFPVLVKQLQAWGIVPVITTLTPCFRYSTAFDTCTTGTGTTVENERVNVVNSWLTNTYLTSDPCNPIRLGTTPFFDDLDSGVGDGNSPEGLQTTSPTFDAGDHVNLTKAGFAALASVIPGQSSPVPFCQFQANVPPQY
jgi:hypothetical protein